MAAKKKPAEAEGASGQEQTGFEVQIVGQLVKDLSFENPGVTQLLEGFSEAPNLEVEVNVEATRVQDELFESGINFNAKASTKQGALYEIEMVYTGLFRLKNIPKQALEPFLLINCPSLLFPFMRRLVADVTREGGYPPLLLDPIDFGQLYMKRQKEAGTAASTSTKLN